MISNESIKIQERIRLKHSINMWANIDQTIIITIIIDFGVLNYMEN